MGQQASIELPAEDRKARWCRDSSDAPKADRETDSVRISRTFQARAGLCSGALPPGPDVLVGDVSTSTATVYWSINQEARKVHLELLLHGEDGPQEVAFFEVGGSQSSFSFPEKTLQKGQGPYQVQLVLETGPEDGPQLTKPSLSEPFWAAEAPGEVPIQLCSVEPESFVVAWELPEDGGIALQAFEVQLQCRKSEAEDAKYTVLLAKDVLRHEFSGFEPGSGPHHLQVRACNAAQLWSLPSKMQVYTAHLAPPIPEHLAARLLPGWARTALSLEGVEDADTDVVKLEFSSSPAGHPIQAYIVHAEEEFTDAEAEKPMARHLEVPVASVTETDRGCSLHLAVEPNRTYIFSVEAFNGRLSGPSAQCVVFAPARVPQAPQAPEVAADGLVAELRWKSAPCGGGLPLEGFKIGVALENGHSPELQREVTYSLAAVTEGHTEKEVSCCARVLGLLPNSRYCFLLAASNSLGTGRWSPFSTFLQTPLGPPGTPVNIVATVAQDAEQQVVVSVTWDCPMESSAISAFDIQLLPAEMQQVRPSSDRRWVHEKMPVMGTQPGERISWAKALLSPGSYLVEVAAEGHGQRSAPAVLSLDVRPEAFPANLPELLAAPSWSEEPYLVLGPATESVPRFGNLEGTWLQALLLWGEVGNAGRIPFSVDVLCFFRRPGSSQVFRANLASEVTTSRLQVALPAHVPMSLRLVAKADPKLARAPRPPMSEPLAVLFTEDGESLQPKWEVWSRRNPSGQPACWTSLPQELQQCIEAAWLEGHPKVALQLPAEGRMAAGSYELTFGDERQTQSTVRKLGPNGWAAKARRTVLTNEDTVAATASSDEMCVICMERRRTHAFMHADTGDGHLAVCVDCAEAYRAEAAVPGGSRAVRTCPMCRRGFTGLQRIYQ